MTANPTPTMQRLNQDFDALFGTHCLPVIAPPSPLSPERDTSDEGQTNE